MIPLVSARISVYVHPVPLIEKHAAVGERDREHRDRRDRADRRHEGRHVHVAPEVPRRCDVADQQQHRDHAEDVALQRGVPAGRRAQKHERHAAEREQREHQRARVDVLAEEPGPDGHDQERRARSDQGGVRDAVVRRARRRTRRGSARRRRRGSTPRARRAASRGDRCSTGRRSTRGSTTARRQNATSTPAVSARLTSVELSENATTSPSTASTPSVFALSARCHAGACAAGGTALIRPP